jgi:hypothetical protein
MSSTGLGGGMRRREFIKLTGGAVAPWPLTTYAQQSAQFRQVGFLFTGPQAVVPLRIAGFLSGLEAGGLPAEKVTIVQRLTGGDPTLLEPKSAAEYQFQAVSLF